MAKHKSPTELEQSHQALEDQIARAMVDRAIDDLDIIELKCLKLRVKDEIERLSREVNER
jgi:hypothetical protein